MTLESLHGEIRTEQSGLEVIPEIVG